MAIKQKKFAPYRGKRLRVTELDFVGRPVYGADSVIVTDGMATVAMTGNIEEGEAISSTNANGDICWTVPSEPKFLNFSVEATFCDVDFALFEKLTGHPVVLNDDGTIVGITEGTTVQLSDINFALELWTGANPSGSARLGAQGEWGYILLPFVRGGTVSDISVENGAITFGVTGMVTKDGSNWGAGPYNVELVNDVAAPLFKPLASTDHRRIMSVEIAPPVARTGSVPLLDRTDPALTGVTATPTGKVVALAPVPTGTDPVWYDFGDGEWDLAETGSYSHTYAAAGTYTVTASRGSSTHTVNVTVT
jgi:hypothetical protein